MEEHWKRLGLTSSASWAEVKSAWRKLSAQSHPDTKARETIEAQKQAEEVQKQLNLAYEKLKGYYQMRMTQPTTSSSRDRTQKQDTARTKAEEKTYADNCADGKSFARDFLDFEFKKAQQLEDAFGSNYDLLKAVEIYRRIASLGHVESQFRLGRIYFDSIMKDLSQAAFWWQLAAENGNAAAQFNLAMLYENGWGVSKSPVKAILWLERAAQAGNPQARSRLGKSTSSTSRQTNYWGFPRKKGK